MSDRRQPDDLVQQLIDMLDQEEATGIQGPPVADSLAGIPLPVLGLIGARGVSDEATARALTDPDDPEAARARDLLADVWGEECPSSELLGRAVASHDASAQQRTIAQANRHLVESLHGRQCRRCRNHLAQLSRDVESLNDVDRVLRSWTFTSVGRPLEAVRGDQSEPSSDSQSFKRELDDPDTYVALVGRPRGERDRWASLDVTLNSGAGPDWVVTVRLVMPDLLHPSVETIVATVHTSAGLVTVPIQLHVRDDVTFSGTATVSAEAQLNPSIIDVKVGRRGTDQ